MINVLKHIFKNRIISNFIVVFLGDGFASVLTLINLSIMIRILGLNQSSLVNLSISYILIFDTVFNFQSFNSIIKFLPNYIVNKNYDKIVSCIHQGFILDILTAIVSFTLSNLSLSFISGIFNWNNDITNLIRIYSLFILFNITGTSIGIIRVFDKFKYSSYINVFVNILKFIFYLLSFIINANMVYFIFLEVIFTLVNTVFVLGVAFRVLRDNKIVDIFNMRIRWDKDFLKFNFYCNFMTTLDVPISHLTPFLINNFIGLEFISVYKVIEKIGGIISKISSPLVNIVYPEISMKVSEKKIGEAFLLVKKLFMFIFIFGIFIFILVYLTQDLWIDILIADGERFVGNILFYILFVMIKFAFVGVYPLFISLGYIRYNIPIIIISNLLYLLIIPILTSKFNINGITVAQFVQAVLVIFMQALVIWFNMKPKDFLL